MSSQSPRIRSIYRQLLRELPPRPVTSRSRTSHLQNWARTSLSYSPPTTPSSSSESTLQRPRTPTPPRAAAAAAAESLSVAEQALLYLRAQRTYVSLLERYNPAIRGDMAQDERVRLTAKRVGMEMPKEFSDEAGKKKKEGGGSE